MNIYCRSLCLCLCLSLCHFFVPFVLCRLSSFVVACRLSLVVCQSVRLWSLKCTNMAVMATITTAAAAEQQSSRRRHQAQQQIDTQHYSYAPLAGWLASGWYRRRGVVGYASNFLIDVYLTFNIINSVAIFKASQMAIIRAIK